MFVVRNKDSKEVLFIGHEPEERPRDKTRLFPGLDKDKMEIGFSDKNHIPEHFNINSKGKVVRIPKVDRIRKKLVPVPQGQKIVRGKIVPKSIDELVRDGTMKLSKLKKQRKELYSAQALAMRREILPDHKLLNTALGLYGDAIAARHKATVKAFIDEFKRVEKLIGKAKTGKRLEAIKPNYPTSILDADE